MKKVILFFAALLALPLLAAPAAAGVIATREPTAGDCIYIAGNPDFYPLEYYDEDTDSYQGLLPQLYREIGLAAGIEFAYISAGPEDDQQRLADNRQVEIVSVYRQGEITALQEVVLFSYTDGAETVTVCIGFTGIADPALVAAVRDGLLSADRQQWLTSAMSLQDGRSLSLYLKIALAAAAVLLIVVLIFVISAIRRRKKKRERDELKETDELTGIGNELYFENRYRYGLDPAVTALYYVGYTALDIDRVETYHDPASAAELQHFAAGVITDALSDNDFCARIGNGVFAFCLYAPDTPRAIQKAEEMVHALNAHSICSGQNHNIAFRCGLCSLETKNIPCETALLNARQGYLAAEREKTDVCLCDDSILQRTALKKRLQQKLMTALDKDEFRLYLQFIVDARSGRFCGAEALSRWHSAQEGVQSPGAYLEDLHAAGLTTRFDLYMLEKCCATLQQWGGGPYRGLHLSCNFTRTTLSESGFLTQFEQVLSKYRFNRHDLIIEITEDSLAEDMGTALRNVSGIRELGCRVALDDMGSGYTSLSDLCDYPIDIIKLDRIFVRRAETPRGKVLLRELIQLAHNLGIPALCEGVETEADSVTARQAHCDYIQGFLYSRVLPAENAMAFYESARQKGNPK